MSYNYKTGEYSQVSSNRSSAYPGSTSNTAGFQSMNCPYCANPMLAPFNKEALVTCPSCHATFKVTPSDRE